MAIHPSERFKGYWTKCINLTRLTKEAKISLISLKSPFYFYSKTETKTISLFSIKSSSFHRQTHNSWKVQKKCNKSIWWILFFYTSLLFVFFETLPTIEIQHGSLFPFPM